MTKAATENGLVTLTQEDLDRIVREAREAAIQAVVTATAGSEPDPEPEPLKVVNLTNATKVAKDLAASEGTKPKKPSGPITYNQRRAVIKAAELGAIKWEDLAGWTTGQASAAIQALRAGYGVKVGPLQLLPR